MDTNKAYKMTIRINNQANATGKLADQLFTELSNHFNSYNSDEYTAIGNAATLISQARDLLRKACDITVEL